MKMFEKQKQFAPRYLLIAVSAFAVATSSCGRIPGEREAGSETCNCAVFGLAETADWQFRSYETSISGHLRTQDWPPNLDGAQFILFVNEKSSYNEEYVRIIEQKFTVQGPIEDSLICGTDDGYYDGENLLPYAPGSDYAETSGSGTTPCICDIGFRLSESAPTLMQASTSEIHIDASYVGPIPFFIHLIYPDPRSAYTMELLIDMDRDGKPSAGDRFTSQPMSINHLATESNLLVDMMTLPFENVDPLPSIPSFPNGPFPEHAKWGPVSVEDHTGFDGCGHLLRLKDGTILQPINLGEEHTVDGLDLDILYIFRPDLNSICMSGPIVEILSLIDPFGLASDE